MSSKALAHIPTDEHNRYPGIDIFRGFAIFTMLCANAAAGSLETPHGYLIRVYGSFAAPVFVFLAGFMVGIGSERHQPLYFLKRAVEIFVVAALIDVLIWRIIPFTTFDVLYLTAFGIPIAALLLRANITIRVILTIVCLAAGPLLQHFIGYREEVNEFSIPDLSETTWPSGVLWWFKSWLIDGWFPVFPWLGFLLSGSIVYSHGGIIVKHAKYFFPLGLAIAGAGVTWMFFHRPEIEREGYSELFYPPGIAYIAAASGVILGGVAMLRYLKPGILLRPLRWLGSCSLFIYILHSALIYFVLDEYFTELTLKKFLLMYLVFATVNILFALLLFELKKKKRWKKLPAIIRFVFGG